MPLCDVRQRRIQEQARERLHDGAADRGHGQSGAARAGGNEAAPGRDEFGLEPVAESCFDLSPVRGAAGPVIGPDGRRADGVAKRIDPVRLAGDQAERGLAMPPHQRIDKAGQVVAVAIARGMPEREAAGRIVRRAARGCLIKGDLRRQKAREHDVLVRDRIGQPAEIPPHVFELPIPPDPVVLLLQDQVLLCLRQITREGRHVPRLRDRQRIGHEIQLVAHRRRLELVDPFEAVEPIDRLQGAIEQQPHQLEIAEAEFVVVRCWHRCRDHGRFGRSLGGVTCLDAREIGIQARSFASRAEAGEPGCQERRHERHDDAERDASPHTRKDCGVAVKATRAHRGRCQRSQAPDRDRRHHVAGREPQRQRPRKRQQRQQRKSEIEARHRTARPCPEQKARARCHQPERQSVESRRVHEGQ